MKTFKKFAFAFLILTGIFLTACDEFDEYDDNPPSVPRNVYTVTGDNRIDIFWDASYDDDVAGYNIYRGYSESGTYKLIGSTNDTYFVDYNVNNGVTYYYAIEAYDYNGNVSDWRDVFIVYDTPRPEGLNQAVFDYNRAPNSAGYSFKNYLVVPYDGDAADFFFENFNGTYYINVWDDSDIQDMGRTNDIWDISYAPSSGWVPLNQGENVKYTEAIVGHTYIIWTWDNHFAKIRVKSIGGDRMVFDWAYQLVEGNPELKIKQPGSERKTHQALLKMN